MRRYRYPLSAFTLVELLVVIAIIALLAALAIPAIGGAIKRSNAAKCMANLKQIGVAYRNYAVENNRLIPSTVTGGGPSWGQTLITSFQPTGWGSNTLLKCPSDSRPINSYYRSYGQNIILSPNTNAESAPIFSTIPEQSKTFLVMEVVKSPAAHPSWGGNYNPTNRHGTNCNVLFVDGHVEALTAATITNAISTLNSDTERTTNAYRWK